VSFLRTVLAKRRTRAGIALLVLLSVAALASLGLSGESLGARLAQGALPALAICGAVGLGGFAFGTLFGAFAGYRRGFFDDGFFRLAEVVDTFPTVVLVPLAQAILPGWEGLTLVALTAVLRTASVARLVRAEIARGRSEDAIFAAQALGSPPLRIVYLHLGRRVLGYAAANAAFGVASVVALEAALAFLGLPARPDSWGALLADGLRTGSGVTTALALGCSGVTVVAVALVGDAIRSEA